MRAPAAHAFALAPAFARSLAFASAFARSLAFLFALVLAVPRVAGAAPRIRVSPSPLDFGAHFLNDQAEQPIVITNLGDSVLTIISVFPPQNVIAYSAFPSLATPVRLAPGESRDASVFLVASFVGTEDATAYFTSDDPTARVYELPCTITGVQGALLVSPMSYDFGAVLVPETAEGPMLVVTNGSILPLTIGGTELSADENMGFAVDSLDTTLAPGASANVRTWFTAGAAGPASARVGFSIQEPVSSPIVTLTAHAITSRLAAAPLSFTFAPVIVGERSAAQTITIANQADEPIAVASIDSDDPDFTVGAALPIALGPSGAATFTVAYAPSGPGAARAHVGVTLDGDAAPALVILAHGSGVVPAAPDPSLFSSSGCAIARERAPSPSPLALAALAALALLARRATRHRSDRARNVLARR